MEDDNTRYKIRSRVYFTVYSSVFSHMEAM